MPETIIDYVTGRRTPLVGAEENRQKIEKYLIEEKGFSKTEIAVSLPIRVDLPDGIYESRVDLVVKTSSGEWGMAIKCAAGSLGSREREILAAARLLSPTGVVPFAVVSDGVTAIVLDVLTGKKVGEGLDQIPGKTLLYPHSRSVPRVPADPERRLREGLIFKSYDSMNLNVLQSPMN